MRINKINIYSPIKFCGLGEKLPKIIDFYAASQDTFEKKTEDTPIVNSRIKENSNQRVPFGVDRNIDKLGDDYIFDRIQKIPKHYKLAASRTALMTNITKEIFDKKYGENNYVVVSIGTSPAGIAKGLELMGQDVRYVPISNLEHMHDYCFDLFDEIPNVFDPDKKYKNFLDSIGLNKEEIEKDKRHYVVIDYTNQGICLGAVSSVASGVLDITSDRVDYLSINNTLNEYTRANCSESVQSEYKKYDELYFQRSFMETFAGIPHLNCKKLEDIDNLLLDGKNVNDFNFEVALYYYLNGGKYED